VRAEKPTEIAVEATEMEERVARVIARDINQHQLDTGFAAPFDFPEAKGGLERDWMEYLSTARAAIRAMREPTLDMIKAGEPVVYDCFSLEPGEGLDENPAIPTWYAMIDTATAPIQEGATAAVPLVPGRLQGT